MLMSRNSKGEIEAYTDIGQFIGILPPDYPGLDLEEYMVDGGAGSGNWGHKGRPGLRGGSGKGGGKQYRGGRSDVAYHGSRKDWLNGLSGERQVAGVKKIADIKRAMTHSQATANRANNLFKHGSISASERDLILEKAGLSKFKEDMTPEEFTMKCRPTSEKKELTDLVAEARSWPETSHRLMNENLTDEEKKVVDYFTKKYGPLGGHDVPDDSGKFEERWKPEDAKVWMDLKSKAMDGPTSGDDIPDEILYESGVKERPAPVAKGPNYDWYKPARGGSMENYMAQVTGDAVSYGARYTKEQFMDLNQRFLDKMKYGKLSPNDVCYYGIRAITGMRDNIEFGMSPENKPTKEMLDRLSEEEKQTMLDFVNRFAADSRFGATTHFDRLEDVTCGDFDRIENKAVRTNGNTIRSAEAKKPFQDYILLQEKMMIGAEPSDRDTEGEKQKQQKAETEQAEKAKREAIKNEQAAFRTSEAAKAKQEKIKRIAAFDVSSISKPETTHQDISKAMSDAGFFHDGARFNANENMPKQLYVDAANAYKNVVDRFPFLAGEFFGFGDEYDNRRANAGCHKEPGNATEIILNYSAMGDHDTFQRDRVLSERMKYKVPVTDYVSAEQATITHEIGHAVANWLHRAVYGEFKAHKTARVYYYDNEVATLLKARTMKALGLKPTDENIKNEISEYAAASRSNPRNRSSTKADEFFAECFCELMCSKKPRRAAVEFGRQLDKFIAENNIDAMTTATTPSTMPKTTE